MRATTMIRRAIACTAFVLCFLPSMAIEIVSGPTLTMDPNFKTPLAGVVELETATPTKAHLRITGDGDSWAVDFPGARTVHSLFVLGMKPDRTYAVEVLLSEALGPAESAGVSLRQMGRGQAATSPSD